MQELTVDPQRWAGREELEAANAFTGIPIRAKDPDGKWQTTDIALLNKDSLLFWLRSRGGFNPFAEDVVGILLAHGHLNGSEPFKPTEEEHFRKWFDTFWKWGSSTDEGKARRAWSTARATINEKSPGL